MNTSQAGVFRSGLEPARERGGPGHRQDDSLASGDERVRTHAHAAPWCEMPEPLEPMRRAAFDIVGHEQSLARAVVIQVRR